jgi:shikimate dehydrogenase
MLWLDRMEKQAILIVGIPPSVFRHFLMKIYYTLDDLEQDGLPTEDGISPRLAVIGHPIMHSKSPQMHQAALDSAGIRCKYIKIEAQPEEFTQVIELLKSLDFIGVNVTVPYKSAAAALAEDCDRLVIATGAANTLVFPRDGNPMAAFNTDGPGFVRAIRECFSVDIRDLKIVLLGANGGAGTALAHTCAMNRCERLTLVARSLEKITPLQKDLSPFFTDEHRLEGAADRLRTIAMNSPYLEEAISDADLIVNATTLGLKQTDASPIPSSYIQPHHLVYDLITHSDSLQQEAREQGARTADGLSMLLHQGALSFERWFGYSPDMQAMRKALHI